MDFFNKVYNLQSDVLSDFCLSDARGGSAGVVECL